MHTSDPVLIPEGDFFTAEVAAKGPQEDRGHDEDTQGYV